MLNLKQLVSLIVVFFCVTLCLTSAQSESSVCTPEFQQGSCLCKLQNGSGTIDFTDYDSTMLSVESYSSLNPWSYNFTFCGVVDVDSSFQSCYGVASVCQWADWDGTYNMASGGPLTTRFELRNSTEFAEPHLAMVTDTDTTLSRTVAFLVCDYAAVEPQLEVLSFDFSKDPVDDYNLYNIQIRTSRVCFGTEPTPPSGGLSTGSILLIIFFSLLFVYFVGGFLFLTFVRGATGYDRIPNRAFWGDLPYMIRDGFVFTFQCCRGGSGTDRHEILP